MKNSRNYKGLSV